MRKLILMIAAILAMSTAVQAEDHVMAATRGNKDQQPKVASLNLSLREAQDYAVEQNRSLKNASMEVQEAYAQRWQTIAAMLPQAEGSIGKTIMYDDDFKEKMIVFPGMNEPMSMSPWSYGVTASVGLNGQAIVGTLLNNVAIDMKKLALEKTERELRGSVMGSYVSVLALQSIAGLLDSSLVNLIHLEEITKNAVQVGAAEAVTADQIHVRVNTLRNNINAQKRNIELATNSLKVLLDVPATTELTLTEDLEHVLSPESVLQLLGDQFMIEKNLDYQLLQKQVELARKNVHMASWAYGPTIGLAYQYNYRDYGKGEGFSMMNSPHTVAFSVSVPLWSSGKRAAGVVEKKIALERAKNTLSETTDNLEIQYRQLCFNLANAYETYLNEKENIEVAQRVFASSSNKFIYGASSSLELTNASNDLISAQSNYITSILSLVEAQVDLKIFLNN